MADTPILILNASQCTHCDAPERDRDVAGARNVLLRFLEMLRRIEYWKEEARKKA